MAKKSMSVYSRQVSDEVIMDTGAFYEKSLVIRYIPISENERKDFIRKDSKELDKWKKILESGFISTLDICRTFENVWRLKYIKAYELSSWRSFVEEKLKNAGYYSYKDRSVYKDGSVFWKLDEIEHVFDGIRAQIEKFIKDLTPEENYWNGELLSVWYKYAGVKLFVDEVRLKKEAHDKEERRRRVNDILNDEKKTGQAMDDVFEKRRQGSRMSITELMEQILEV